MRRLFVLAIALAVHGCDGAVDVSAVETPWVTLVEADPARGIVARFDGVDITLAYTARGVRVGRWVIDGQVVASVTLDDNIPAATFTVGTSTWSRGDAAPTDELRLFATTRGGRAIHAAVSELYWLTDALALKPLRFVAVEMYEELAPHWDDSAKQFAQPWGSLPGSCKLRCQLITADAMFRCVDPNDDGFTVDVLPLMSERGTACLPSRRSHEGDQCYGACGAGCGYCPTLEWRCTENQITWATNPPTTGTMGTSTPEPCFDRDPSEPNPKFRYTPNQARCSTPSSYPAGQLIECTQKSACFDHDECTRHDTQLRHVYLCHTTGRSRCGAASCAWGEPPQPFAPKWFNAIGEPLVAATPDVGSCTWTASCAMNGTCTPTALLWQANNPLSSHDREQAPCLVHGCKHPGSADYCPCTTDADCPAVSLLPTPERSCRSGRCTTGTSTPGKCPTPPTCTNDLSNIGTADFTIRYTITTTASGPNAFAVLHQRSLCSHSHFWDNRLVTNGGIRFELDDNDVNYAINVGAIPVNDGVAHQVEICRVGGELRRYVDTVEDAPPLSAATNLGALPPMGVISGSPCIGPNGGTPGIDYHDGTMPLPGSVTNICVGRL